MLDNRNIQVCATHAPSRQLPANNTTTFYVIDDTVTLKNEIVMSEMTNSPTQVVVTHGVELY